MKPLVAAVAPLAACGWTVYDVLAATDDYDRRHQLPPVRVDAQRNPLGLLIHRIRRSCSPGARPTGTPRPQRYANQVAPPVPEPQQRAQGGAERPSDAYLQWRTAAAEARTSKPLRTRRTTEINLDRARRTRSLGTRWAQHEIDTRPAPTKTQESTL